jgi:LacI family transcriptional regulator
MIMSMSPDQKADRASLRDVARLAGVHPSTASRALNKAKNSRIPAETATRIQKVADLLGYRPDPAAASLRTNRSRAIGVLVPRLSDPVLAAI